MNTPAAVFQCRFCPKVFMRENRMRIHESNRHAVVPVTLHICPIESC